MSEQPGGHERPQSPSEPPHGVPPEVQGQPDPTSPHYGQLPPPGHSPYGPPPFVHHSTHAQPTHPAYGQVGYGQPGFPMPGYGPAPRDPDKRPGTVLAAAIVTIVMSGTILLMLSLFTLILLATRSAFLEGFNDSAGLTDGDPGSLFGLVLGGMLFFVAWCVAAIVLAVLVLRRRNWARIALVVSSGFTVLVSLVAIGSAVSVLPLACAIAVIVLLFTGGAGDWLRHEHAYSPPRPLA